jgi:hypothetical protein
MSLEFLATVQDIDYVASKLVSAVNNYLKLVKSLDEKVNQLAESQLNSALDFLKQARNSNLPKVRYDCLNSARIAFTTSLHLEEGERLVIAYIGLALCFNQLGDWNNFVSTLQQFSEKKINIRSLKGAISQKMGLNELGDFIRGSKLDKVFTPNELRHVPSRKFIVGGEKELIGVSSKQDTIWDLQEEAKVLVLKCGR